MGYAGKLHVGQVKKDELILEESNGVRVYPSENSIQISEVSSMIIGLLPFYLEIEVEKLTHRIRKPVAENLSEVKLVRDMVFLLRNIGYRWVNGYYIKLKDFPDSYITFTGEQADVIIKDTEQSQNLIERLNQIFNP